MPVFKEMDPLLVWKLIEGYDDELTDAAAKQDEFYAKFRCPRCRCGLQKEFDSRIAWKSGEPLAQFLLRCDNCGYVIDPHTGLVVQYGDASKVPTPDVIPIIG